MVKAYEFTNRQGVTITLDKALAYLGMSAEEAACRMYFRVKALKDDTARKKSGALAGRLYSPDATHVPDEQVPPVLDAACEAIAAVNADLAAGRSPQRAGMPHKTRKPSEKPAPAAK